MTDAAREALRRNDRFLGEFVEAHDVCPYARRCRESGGLERRVIESASPTVADVVAHAHALSTDAFRHVEVALLLFPALTAAPPAFERFVADVRETAAKTGPFAFYAVAFHPDLPADIADPARFVSFLRKSPDPTIQLVRADLLERIRGPDVEDTMWVDPASLDLAAPSLPAARKSVSTRIAEANFKLIEHVGEKVLLRLLEDLHADRRMPA